MSISTAIKTIQDIMRKDAGVGGDAQRIGQLVWMLFLKIFDDREQEYEFMDETYASPIPEHLRWRNWADDPEGMTDEELLDFVNDDLLKTLKNLSFTGVSDPRGFVVREVFEDSYNYMKNGTLIRQIVNKINEINFRGSENKRLFGDVYEMILKDLQNAGNTGEFYTPRAVTEFMVQMVSPTIGEKLLDPACGTGGFLTSSIDYLREKMENVEDEQILQNSIYGIEKKTLPHLLCITNMLLHGIEVPSQIRRDNSLARPLGDYKLADKVDVIITDPPFGGVEWNGIETFYPPAYQTRETADLFLVLIIHLLKNNGRCAIVLPDSILFGEGVKTCIKKKLLNECNLHTIVRLPNGVFTPYTGIKTNLLFFTKGESTKEIWYYEHPYPDGYKFYSKTKPMKIQEFEPEKVWWNNREENEFAWKVTIDQIRAINYNLDIKNPYEKAIDHGDSGELLTNYKIILSDISETRNTLKEELMSALEEQKRMNPESFFDNFELFAESPNGIQKLREMILQMAVQGKLVPQDAADESAELLLGKIWADKENLVKEKKINKIKTLNTINSNEIPFELPLGWMWVRIGDIVKKLGAGSTPKGGKSIYQSTGIKFIRSQNVWNDGLLLENVALISLNIHEKMNGTVVEPRDILLNVTGASIGRSSVVPDDFDEGNVSQNVAILRPIDMEISFFVHICIISPLIQDLIMGAQVGITRERLSMTKLKDFIIPLPPIEEQKHIVEKVNILINLCNQLEKKIIDSNKNAETLMDAVLIEAAGEFK